MDAIFDAIVGLIATVVLAVALTVLVVGVHYYADKLLRRLRGSKP